MALDDGANIIILFLQDSMYNASMNGQGHADQLCKHMEFCWPSRGLSGVLRRSMHTHAEARTAACGSGHHQQETVLSWSPGPSESWCHVDARWNNAVVMLSSL